MHLSYLQAFTDVNKRTARLAANISLIKQNLVPLVFSGIEINDYMSAMIAVYELQEIQPLIELYCFSYKRTCVTYDATVLALGFDEVRVRYRQQRRAILQEIILQKIFGEKMQNYILSKANSEVAEIDQSAFIDDVLEDLSLMDESRLAGLGITSEQLHEWKLLKK